MCTRRTPYRADDGLTTENFKSSQKPQIVPFSLASMKYIIEECQFRKSPATWM